MLTTLTLVALPLTLAHDASSVFQGAAASAPSPAPSPTAAAASARAPSDAPLTPQSAMARFAALAGDWDADITGDGEPDTVVTYRTIAGGSCVAETLFGGEPHEMITMYHLDGDRLLCTHYCAAQNQPRMAATAYTPDSVAFTFLDCTNLTGPDAMRMDSVKFTFNEDGTVVTDWGAKAGGEEQEHAVFTMKRRVGEDAATEGAPLGRRPVSAPATTP